MAKKYRTIQAKEKLCSEDLCGSLSDIISKLQAYSERFGDDAVLDVYLWGGWNSDSELEVSISYERPETDAERNERLKKARAKREQTKKNRERLREEEYKEYLKLREKYGDIDPDDV